MNIERLVATMSKPSDATAYAAGDIIANSLTAASVVPLIFSPQRDRAGGKLLGAKCTVKPASGNLVITAFDFDLLVFRADTDIPFAAAGYPADNGALTISEAAMKSLIASFSFVNGAWRNPAGGVTADAQGVQQVAPSGVSPMPFGLDGAATHALHGVLQAKAAWTPGAVVQAFTLELLIENG